HAERNEPFASGWTTHAVMITARSHTYTRSQPRRVLLSCVAALVSAAALSCGDDSGDKTPVAGSSGGGGSAGSAGSTAGTVAPPMPVPCGSTMCTPRPNPLTALIGQFAMGAAVPGLPSAVACCIDASKGTYGVAAAEGAM